MLFLKLIHLKPTKKSRLRTQLCSGLLDEGALGTHLKLTEAQRINLKPRDLPDILLGATLVSAGTLDDEGKVNAHHLTYRTSFKIVQELGLTNTSLKKSLSCENQKDLGIICSRAMK